MLKVGLTGGMASGKTLVGEMFVSLGAHLIQADQIAHQLMQPGQPVYDQVVGNFGRGILNADGSVNRRKLAEAAFGAPGGTAPRRSRVDELNRIVHPAVIREQESWMEKIGSQDPHAVAMVEAALILEAGVANRFDRLIVVTCSEEQRAVRFAERQKISLEAARAEVSRRMAAQVPDREKVKSADYVIDNTGSLDHTRDQVQKVWHDLRSAAGKVAPK